LNITETKISGEESENYKSNEIWIEAAQSILETLWLLDAPECEVDTSNETFGTTDVLEADGSIHV